MSKNNFSVSGLLISLSEDFFFFFSFIGKSSFFSVVQSCEPISGRGVTEGMPSCLGQSCPGQYSHQCYPSCHAEGARGKLFQSSF